MAPYKRGIKDNSRRRDGSSDGSQNMFFMDLVGWLVVLGLTAL